LAAVALALGYGLGGLWTWMPIIVALALLWLIGHWRGWGWTSSLGLVFTATVAAAGLLLGVAAGWMLLGLVAALAAWALDSFRQRLRSVESVAVQARRDLERRHIQRLLAVAGLGLLLAAVVLGIKLELKFGVVLLLGLLAILGLGQTIGFLNRQSH
jgi:hypothetical protein